MDKLKNLMANLSKRQKLVFLVGFFFFIILIAILIFIQLNNTPKVTINGLSEKSKNISHVQKMELGNYLWSTISQTPEYKNNPQESINDVEIRDETFDEYTNPEGITYISFIVDIDSLKQSYKIILRSKDNSVVNAEDLAVECPPYNLLKYKETKCYSSENTSSSIENYLPYSEQVDGYYFTASIEYYVGDPTWYIQIKFDTCNNLPKLFEQAKKMTLDYLEENTVDTKDLVFELYRNYHLCPNL